MWCALYSHWSPPFGKVATTNYTDKIKKQQASNEQLSMQKSPDSTAILDPFQPKINTIVTTLWNTFLKNRRRINDAGFTVSERLSTAILPTRTANNQSPDSFSVSLHINNDIKPPPQKLPVTPRLGLHHENNLIGNQHHEQCNYFLRSSFRNVHLITRLR